MYNHFADKSRSLMSSCWDNNIYRIYSDDETYKYVPGYSIGIHDKMFFGSTCIALHNNYIELDKWNYEDGVNYSYINMDEHNVNPSANTSY